MSETPSVETLGKSHWRKSVLEIFRRRSSSKQEIRDYGKVLVLGSTKVGKTAIIQQLCILSGKDNYIPTTETTTYKMNNVFETEQERKATKKDSVEGKASRRRISRIVKAGASNDNNNNTNDSYLKGSKCLNLFFVDTPGEMNLTMPLEYRALISEARAFLLVCEESNEESISCVQSILSDLTLCIDENIPRIIVVTSNDEAGVVNAESVYRKLENYAVSICEMPLRNNSGINKLSMILLTTLNRKDDEQQAEEEIPKGLEFVEASKRWKMSKRKSIFM